LEWAGNVARFKEIGKARTILVLKLKGYDLVGNAGPFWGDNAERDKIVWEGGYWFILHNGVPTVRVLSNCSTL
jgi:hypothetical protein